MLFRSGEALQLYGVLTIGDGLVSQIPSLLIAISAGILVTRSGGESDNVGEQIGDQIFSQPRAMLIASMLVFLFALIPGFPKAQLFSLAFILGAIGYALKYMKKMSSQSIDPKKEIQKTLSPAASKGKMVKLEYSVLRIMQNAYKLLVKEFVWRSFLLKNMKKQLSKLLN